MSREEIARLLGGYATGTLTPEEQRELFAAALEDQALFDELAREQTLRDLLSEPAARAQVLAALEEQPRWRRFGAWMMRPAGLSAAAACVLLVTAIGIWRPWRAKEAAKPVVVATALPREAPAVPPPAAEGQAAAVTTPRIVAKPSAPAGPPRRSAAGNPVPSAEADALASQNRRIEEAVQPAAPAPPTAPSPSALANQAVKETAAPATSERQTPASPAALAFQETSAISKLTQSEAAELKKVQSGVADSALARAAAPAARMAVRGAMAGTAGGGARHLYYAVSAPLGIKWSILRRAASGEFALAGPADLRAGDIVELRLVSNQGGEFLGFDNANEKAAPLFARHVEAGEIFDTPPLPAAGKGPRQIVVVLTGEGNDEKRAMPQEPRQSETVPSENATYTVGQAGAKQVLVTISLNYR